MKNLIKTKVFACFSIRAHTDPEWISRQNMPNFEYIFPWKNVCFFIKKVINTCICISICSVKHLGTIFGPFGHHFGPPWSHLGSFLSLPWTILGSSWGNIWVSWLIFGHLGSILGHLEYILGHFNATWSQNCPKTAPNGPKMVAPWIPNGPPKA